MAAACLMWSAVNAADIQRRRFRELLRLGHDPGQRLFINLVAFVLVGRERFDFGKLAVEGRVDRRIRLASGGCVDWKLNNGS